MLAAKIGYFRATLDPDAAAYIAAVEAADGQALEAAVRTAINSFVVGCKTDGIWSAIKASCILMGARTLSGCLVPLVGTAPTNNSFVSADYDRRTGLVGDGSTKWLNSNRNNNADPQDSKHLAVWRSGVQTVDAGLLGSGNTTGDSHVYAGFGSFIFRNNAQTAANQPLGVMTGSGFLGTSRSASASFSYRIGTTNYTATVASQTPRNASVRVFETIGRTNARLAFYSIGESLTLSLLGSRVSALVSALSFALRPQVSNADAQSWIDRVYANGGEVSTTTATAVNNFCNSIDSAGIRDRFYRLNLFAGTGLAAALVPLYRGQSLGGTQFGGTTDTNSNFVSGDYAETGTSGGLGTGATNSTKMLDTGLVPFNAGITHSNSHLAYYSRQGNATSGAVMASAFAVTSQEHWQLFSQVNGPDMNIFYRSGGNANSGFEGASNLLPRTGLIMSQRSGSSASLFRNGTNISLTASTTNATTWTTDRPRAMRVFAMRFINNNVDSTIQYIATTLQAYSMGLSMTDAQAASYHTAMQAFQTALGRQL